MNKVRILFVTSHWRRWAAFEWLSKRLDPERFDISWAVIIRKESPPIVDYLRACAVPVYEIPYFSSHDRLLAPIRIAQLCKLYKVEIVHTHFYNANMVGLLGSLLAGIKHRIHTRHYADAYDGSIIRKLKARLYNRVSTGIIAPSGEVRKFLLDQERAPADKVALIYHGFDLESFRSPPQQQVEALRQHYGIQSSGPVIGVISRYSYIKGVQYIIPAFRQLLISHPKAQLVLAEGGMGDPYYSKIKTMLATLPEGRCVQIAHEDKVFALYPLFDVFVHVPILARVEGFGQVYIEALAASVPSVFTPSGIAGEFMRHGKTAWMVEHQNSDQIHAGIKGLLSDSKLCQNLRRKGQQLVRDRFNLDAMMEPLEQLYQKCAQKPVLVTVNAEESSASTSPSGRL